MPPEPIDFDAPHLAVNIEQLSQDELDHLSFGVILVNREGTVLFYSKTEAKQSGYRKNPVGRNLFEISSCMAGDNFRGRIMRAMEDGPVDLEFGWVGDFLDPKRDLRFRILSSTAKDVWIFVERDTNIDV